MMLMNAWYSFELKVPVLCIHIHKFSSQINIHTTVKQVIDQLKNKFNATNEDYTLHEVLCDGALGTVHC